MKHLVPHVVISISDPVGSGASIDQQKPQQLHQEVSERGFFRAGSRCALRLLERRLRVAQSTYEAGRKKNEQMRVFLGSSELS